MTEPPFFPEATMRRLLGYITVVRDTMRMQAWDVTLHLDPLEEDDAHAMTWQATNHSTINLRLSRDFFDQSALTIRNSIVHELVHAQHRDMTELWEACTINNSSIAPRSAREWNDDMVVHTERFVAWVTQRIEPQVPLPDPDQEYPVGEGVALFGEHVS